MARLASLLLLGAAVVAAHPGHGHNHAHKHRAVQERADGDMIYATINGEIVSWVQEGDYYGAAAAKTDAPTTTPTPVAGKPKVNVAAAATTTTPAATATPTSDPSSDDSDDTTESSTDTTGFFVSEYTDFSEIEKNCPGISSKNKRATLAQITQVGNTGGTCYGSNMLVMTDAAVAAQYDNTIKMYGATEDMKCAIWNKAGPTGLVDGFYKSVDAYFTLDLPANGVVYIAADNGTAGGASCFSASEGIQFDTFGAIAGTWLEFTFVDVTTSWSAYDASCIIAENADMTINGLEVCLTDGTTCSSIGAGLSSISAAFNAALAAADGIGGNFDGTMKIAANWGF